VPAETRVNALQQGGLDLVQSADYSLVDLFRDHPRVRVFETQPLSLARLVFNVDRPPLDDRRVRRALAHALDRRQLAEVMTKGPAIVGHPGIVPPDTPWHHPDVQQYAFDPAKSMQLLDAAGYRAPAGGGERFTLELLADPAARDPELLQPMLATIGVGLSVKRLDAKARTQLQRELRYQSAFATHIGVGGDPDYLRRWYAGEEANDFAQGSVFHHAEYDRLGRAQAAASDPSVRRPLVARMQEILAEELPTLALYHRRFLWLYDAQRLQPMNTWGGLMNGIPFVTNKLAFLPGAA
jgi:peptide/nickel transport system substrate-binding protein